MNCYKCGKNNDDDSNYCKHCGNNLKDPDEAFTNPHYTIFDNPARQAKLNTEIGYLIIAIVAMLNVSLWVSWRFLFGTMNGNEALYKGLRLFSVIFSVGQFIVMFIFSRRAGYRIAIGIIAGILILYDLYYFVLMLAD